MSPAPTPSTATATVAESLRQRLVDRHGGPVDLVTPPSSNEHGFDSAIHFVHFSGPTLPREWSAPLVVRVKPTIDGLEVARREAEVQNWTAQRGYPTPRVLEVFAPGELTDRPTQVMERAPGAMLLDAVQRRPWQLRRRLRALADLQADLHRLDPAGFPTDDDLFDRRLGLTRAVVEEFDHAPLRAALARVELLAPRARDAPAAVCHGDFHPLNVIVDAERSMVVDWSDAGVGDRHGDVARTLLLLELAALAASGRIERTVLRVAGPIMSRWYRRAYDALAPLDPQRLAIWRPVHLVHGWSQAIAAEAGMFADRDVDVADRLPPGFADALHRRLEAALAAVAEMS